MSEGIGFVVSMCMVVSLCSFISYSRTDGRVTSLALGIILISSLIVPIGSVVSSFDTLGDDFSYGGTVDSEAREEQLLLAYKNGIKAAIAEEFSVDKEQISVEIVGFDSGEFTCTLCRVSLHGKAALVDYRRVESLLLGCGAKKGEVIISL